MTVNIQIYTTAVINPTESPEVIKIPNLNDLIYETFEVVSIKYTHNNQIPKNTRSRIQLLKKILDATTSTMKKENPSKTYAEN